jgi:hypothetical protein
MSNQRKHKNDLGKPVDPAVDPQSLMGDAYGLSGITNTPSGDTLDPIQTDEESDTPFGMVSLDSMTVASKARTVRVGDQVNTDDILYEELEHSSNNTINDSVSPSVLGEQLVSGSDPDPESDDDTLLNSHQVGLRLDEDEENPRPLNIAEDVAAAERRRREMD